MGFYLKIKCPLYGIQEKKEVDKMAQIRAKILKCTLCQGQIYKTEQLIILIC